jgi:hypothetical protein
VLKIKDSGSHFKQQNLMMGGLKKDTNYQNVTMEKGSVKRDEKRYLRQILMRNKQKTLMLLHLYQTNITLSPKNY